MIEGMVDRLNTLAPEGLSGMFQWFVAYGWWSQQKKM